MLVDQLVDWSPFWAAALEGQMTYDSTQGNFSGLMSRPPALKQGSQTPNQASQTPNQVSQTSKQASQTSKQASQASNKAFHTPNQASHTPN